VRCLVAIFEERVEGGVLGQVGLHGREPVRDEVVEPVVGEDFRDPVSTTIHVFPIGTGRRFPMGRLAYLFRGVVVVTRPRQVSSAWTLFRKANSPVCGSSSGANQPKSATSSAGAGSPDRMRAVQ
jgi:hypothetical protein